jgi:hypothetical protein
MVGEQLGEQRINQARQVLWHGRESNLSSNTLDIIGLAH